MPRARISTTGAMPEPSFRFEPGQCITLTSRSASSACSASVDPDAVRGAQPLRRQAGVGEVLEVRQAARQPPHDFDLVPRFRTRGCGRATPLARRQRGHRLEQLARARHREARRERGAQPAVRPRRPSACCSATLSSIERCVRSCSRAGTSLVRVHHALADGRAQADLRQRLEHHVGVVHGLHRQRRGGAGAAAARRPPAAPTARSVDGVCAASIGQTRRRSHSSSGMSSAKPRNSVWQRWTWVWMKPGRR